MRQVKAFQPRTVTSVTTLQPHIPYHILLSLLHSSPALAQQHVFRARISQRGRHRSTVFQVLCPKTLYRLGRSWSAVHQLESPVMNPVPAHLHAPRLVMNVMIHSRLLIDPLERIKGETVPTMIVARFHDRESSKPHSLSDVESR